MLWVINCTAKPNIKVARERDVNGFTAHKHYLDAKMEEGTVVLTGSSVGDDAKTRKGSVYIINVGSYAEARAFYEADPNVKAGLYESVTITGVKKNRWNPAAAQSAEGRGDGPKK